MRLNFPYLLKWFTLIAVITFTLHACSAEKDEQINNLTSQVEELEEQLEIAEEEKSELKQQLSEYDVNIEEMNDELEEKEEELKDQESKIDELTKQLEEAKQSASRSGSKQVFLTFDDGPSKVTPKILDILKEHNIPATFFAIGQSVEEYPHYTRRAQEEGHKVLPHSHSHDYSIYSDLDSFYDDFYQAKNQIEEVLDQEIPPYFRFPGGATNQVSTDYGGDQIMAKITEDVKERGYYYFDWNVSSNDANHEEVDALDIYNNVVATTGEQDFAVVLFHDSPTSHSTAEALPRIIDYYESEGYEFRTFQDLTEKDLNKMKELNIANKTIY
ncbi:polysaccharide deacetylase family protein [Alkalibacillus silvisoli]|uniref:NodB homology domain-containing protein n=1 Tax=Alkalibacillus silvisoli TaxID=392823 RepID=A0ABN1A3T4_9BACI